MNMFLITFIFKIKQFRTKLASWTSFSSDIKDYRNIYTLSLENNLINFQTL